MKAAEYQVENRIGWITLNRPDKRNALNAEMVEALSTVFDQAAADPAVRIIVLRANGKAFCAGADLESLQQLQRNTYDENLADSRQLMNLFWKIYSMEKVVIAEVFGHALAGGCGLASLCDFIFASHEAKFGYTEVKIGFIPALVSIFLLTKIGEQSARNMLLSGDPVSSEEAKRLGLVHEVVPAADLPQSVLAFAIRLAEQNAPGAMARTKRLIYSVRSKGMLEALELAAIQNAEARSSEECQRGIAAFLNKEKLLW